MLMGGGAAGMLSSYITKKEPFATLGIVVGGVLLGLGVLDVTGIMPFNSIADKIKGLIPGGASSGYSGAFSAANLPYDPNNYYTAPRDTSIMP